MNYEPKEGVDYIVDLYAVAGVSSDATPEELKQSLNERIKEYHPDRLQGIAPEFRREGERMALLLNKARRILLHDQRRAEYDEIANGWAGPVSMDGTPAITIQRHLQMEMAQKTPDEIEAIFAEQAKKIEAMTGYSPSRLTFLEGMIASSNGEVNQALSAEYEDALLQRDRVLALQEAERSQLLGLPDIRNDNYVAAIGYGEAVKEKVEETRAVQKEQLQLAALGAVSTRLALLSGERAAAGHDAIIRASTTIELPHYFEDQARKIEAIAQSREEISRKRLENFTLTYPEAALQTELKENLAIGIGPLWLGVTLDDERQASVTRLPEAIEALLQASNFKAVIAEDFNVLTFELLEQLDLQDMLLAAIQKHIDTYSATPDPSK